MLLGENVVLEVVLCICFKVVVEEVLSIVESSLMFEILLNRGLIIG